MHILAILRGLRACSQLLGHGRRVGSDDIAPLARAKTNDFLMFKALRDGNREVLVSGKIHIILLGGEEAEALTCCHLLLLLLRALILHPGTNFEDKPCTSTKPRRGRYIYRIGC